MNLNFRLFYCQALNVELPTEFEVHHIDMNRENNVIQNLVAIPVKLHRHYHNCQIMSFPELERYIPITPPPTATSPGNSFFNLILAPAFYEFEKIYYELQSWIEYRDHFMLGFPNHKNLSYTKEQADKYIWITNKEKASIRKAIKKKEKEVDPAYPNFVKLWVEAYPELGFNALSGSKIKSLISQSKAILVENGRVPTQEACENIFRFILAYLKRSGNWLHGKSISVVDSKYREIYFEIKNGKINTTKQPTTRERINSL